MSFVIRCKGPASNFELRSKLLNAEGEGRRSLGGAHLRRYGRALAQPRPVTQCSVQRKSRRQF